MPQSKYPEGTTHDPRSTIHDPRITNNEPRMTTHDQRAAQIKAMLKQQLLQFKSELKGHRVFLFGSRAAGNARPRSDFDVGAYGEEPLPLKTFFAIEDTFDDLPTLYKIDWVDRVKVVVASVMRLPVEYRDPPTASL